jgi:hypothetical protein
LGISIILRRRPAYENRATIESYQAQDKPSIFTGWRKRMGVAMPAPWLPLLQWDGAPTGKPNGLGIVDIASGSWYSDRSKIRDHTLAQ